MSELDKALLLNGKIEVLSGFAFPSSGFNQLDGLPLIRIRDLSGSTTEVRFRGVYDPAYRVSKGDLLVGMDGDFEVYRWEGEDALLNQRVCKISSTSREIDQGFLYWYLKPNIAEIHRRTPQTTVRHLSTKDIYAIAEPPVGFPAQECIAQILDTLDTAIRETEALIDKLKAVKQGLLHDLLTRGIDANGQLRPPQSEAPQLYKESPLGWIPREWNCTLFGELCESSAFGPRFPSDAYDENGPLATLRTTDMDDEGNLSLTTMPRAAIAPLVFADHLLRPGDIVISRSGTCGVTGVFTDYEIPVVPGAFLIRFRLRDIRLNRFYRRYFNSSLGRPYLERLAVGGVQKNIKGSDVLCLPVPAPTPREAVDISERIESVEHDIGSNQQLLSKFRLQKAGLMDDLLTGRVRVTPLLESVQRTAEPTEA
ncbi:restriction endonuclease subunit S [Stutzerimonas stutzeri]|uniref:restriction endonuclease subunit S n=1 Tax=Stutzerimonas stutzeri TaxID=316 RepID=UPI003CFC2839